jgi:hypothetical protein
MIFHKRFCLFVCLFVYSHQAAVTITDKRAADLDLFLAFKWILAVKVLLHATRDLSVIYGLIQ